MYPPTVVIRNRGETRRVAGTVGSLRFRTETPLVTACTYCGCDVYDHDPVFVYEEADGERVEAGAFCNYACLTAHVEEAGLAVGATCELSD